LITAGDVVPAGVGQIRATESYIEVENIGKAAALNVTIDDVLIRGSFTSALGPLIGEPVWFESLSSLSAKEKLRIPNVESYDRAEARVVGQRRPDLLSKLNPHVISGKHELVVRFSDILGNRYAQVHTVDRHGTSVGVIRTSEHVKRNIVTYNGVRRVNTLTDRE
jgi:hypothetical protein